MFGGNFLLKHFLIQRKGMHVEKLLADIHIQQNSCQHFKLELKSFLANVKLVSRYSYPCLYFKHASCNFPKFVLVFKRCPRKLDKIVYNKYNFSKFVLVFKGCPRKLDKILDPTCNEHGLSSSKQQHYSSVVIFY